MFFRSFILGLLASLFVAVSAFGASPLEKGKTGIESIDTLTVNEWDIPTERNSLPLTMLFSILPGGGQYYTEHYVRGGFITGIELLLFYEVTFNKSYQYDRVLEQAQPFRDSVGIYTNLLIHSSRDSIEFYQGKRQEYAERVRSYNDKKMEQEDLRKAETAWLYGLHLYSMLDAFGIWYNNNYRSVELKSMSTAVLWSIIPGGGQIYNREFGKAGLLYMALIGSAVSVWTSQNMVEYYLDRKHLVGSEQGTSSEEYDKIQERVTYYRKNRNQYIWAGALLYLYSIGDAAVDALLSDFDNPIHMALLPTFGGGAQALFTFDF